jgi:hypothetical protein
LPSRFPAGSLDPLKEEEEGEEEEEEEEEELME